LKRFKVDARALLTIGRDSIKDHTTAVIELVKNAYDADATQVNIDLSIIAAANKGTLKIIDNGEGMSEREIERHWLRIGFSEKKKNTTSAQNNRRKTGEKGIGRLSADRLGKQLHLKSKKEKQKASGLLVDWTAFDEDAKELGDIELQVSPDPIPEFIVTGGKKALTGTELSISGLRQSWTKEDITKLRAELSYLLSPYNEQNQNFKILLTNDVDVSQNGIIESNFISNAEVDLDAKLDANGTLIYSISYHVGIKRAKKTHKGQLKWADINVGGKKGRRPKCGPVRFRLSFFPRKSQLLEANSINFSQLRSFLDANAGVRIYRDQILVKPYGDPLGDGGDWLGLAKRRISNPVGRASKDFRIAPNQLVGAVSISRDSNPALIDSSSREGLIEEDAFRELRAISLIAVSLIEIKYYETSPNAQEDITTKAATAKKRISTLKVDLGSLRGDLVQLRKQSHIEIDSSSNERMHALEDVIEKIEVAEKKIEFAEKDIDELASQNTVLRGLATVGIASAVFGHETESASDLAVAQLMFAENLLSDDPIDLKKIKASVLSAKNALDRISSWGKFALGRVKRDKRQRKTVNVQQLVMGVLNELERPLKESSIKLSHDTVEVTAKTVPMDVEAILVNLITNAYHAVGLVKKNRKIVVCLHSKFNDQRAGFELTVEDSGPGIAKEYETAIWTPLFSTKVDTRNRQVGTGLGLTIVKSICEELGGEVTSTRKGIHGGALFRVWLPS
jgi:signal transduction histidine kinase